MLGAPGGEVVRKRLDLLDLFDFDYHWFLRRTILSRTILSLRADDCGRFRRDSGSLGCVSCDRPTKHEDLYPARVVDAIAAFRSFGVDRQTVHIDRYCWPYRRILERSHGSLALHNPNWWHRDLAIVERGDYWERRCVSGLPWPRAHKARNPSPLATTLPLNVVGGYGQVDRYTDIASAMTARRRPSAPCESIAECAAAMRIA